MNALLFERPVRFATGPLILEEAQQMEDFTYHDPVLVMEVVELLAPQPGTLVVDATSGAQKNPGRRSCIATCCRDAVNPASMTQLFEPLAVGLRPEARDDAAAHRPRPASC